MPRASSPISRMLLLVVLALTTLTALADVTPRASLAQRTRPARYAVTYSFVPATCERNKRVNAFSPFVAKHGVCSYVGVNAFPGFVKVDCDANVTEWYDDGACTTLRGRYSVACTGPSPFQFACSERADVQRAFLYDAAGCSTQVGTAYFVPNRCGMVLGTWWAKFAMGTQNGKPAIKYTSHSTKAACDRGKSPVFYTSPAVVVGSLPSSVCARISDNSFYLRYMGKPPAPSPGGR